MIILAIACILMKTQNNLHNITTRCYHKKAYFSLKVFGQKHSKSVEKIDFWECHFGKKREQIKSYGYSASL